MFGKKQVKVLNSIHLNLYLELKLGIHFGHVSPKKTNHLLS